MVEYGFHKVIMTERLADDVSNQAMCKKTMIQVLLKQVLVLQTVAYSGTRNSILVYISI